MTEPVKYYKRSQRSTHFYGIKEFWNEFIDMKLSFCVGWGEEHGLLFAYQ